MSNVRKTFCGVPWHHKTIPCECMQYTMGSKFYNIFIFQMFFLLNFHSSVNERWIQVQVYALNKSYAVSISQVGSFAKTWVTVLVILWRLQLAKNKRQNITVVNKEERSGGNPDWLFMICTFLVLCNRVGWENKNK